MRYFTYFLWYQVVEIQCVFYDYYISLFRQASFHVLSSFRGLVAILLDGANLNRRAVVLPGTKPAVEVQSVRFYYLFRTLSLLQYDSVSGHSYVYHLKLNNGEDC